MNRSKTNLLLAALTVLGILLTSCEKDEGTNTIPQGTKKTVTGEISENTLWAAEDTIFLDGFVYVKPGVTLTIEPGTIIKGISDTKACLIVERGAKIEANGTAQKPIVFTSDKPAGERKPGDWAGIIICGKAPINQTGGEAEIEGGTGATFGGSDPNDNSGTLHYVRIEFAGYEVSNGNEINGLTLGGVGSGTTIEYVQVSFGRDDSFEWFGGTVNAKYLVSYRAGDDDFDTDNGFSGNVQFGFILRGPEEADKTDASNGFESDNDASGSSNSPLTSAKFSNITILGPYATKDQQNVNPNHKYGLRLRRNTRLSLYNSIIAGFNTGLYIEGPSKNLYNTANGPEIKNCIMAGMIKNYNVKTDGSSLTEQEYDAMFTNGNNTLFDENSQLKISNSWNWGNVNPLPESGSPVLNGASFEGLTGFEQVSFRGAFGSTNWTAQWCNWDPQNTAY
ncbi:T9SS C-terminal target domain-containing protein [Tenuifilum thalassicum]|uniref:T9SS C-terminal target domain-containing protein n=1 Tax=Tenuifilum thalassicum TaxID=2590900 RepID=A0A7D3XH00_9BACT|nr:T9SS C-terminal target domain-containing protein [Tenuifilum thalassicum]QKG80317.1 T9SS C-terminal target domain-containing protein [Tenuifilum thalassicum]